MPLDAVELLLTSELLRGVTEAQLRAIAPPPERVQMRAGETVISQGEPGQAFYFLVHGRLRVFVQDRGHIRRVGDVVPGEGVGEMSLMSGDLTSATARVMHDSTLIRFSRESYLQLMQSCPEAALQVMRTMIKRLRQGLTSAHHTRFATIAVVPLDATIDAGRFTAALVAEIDRLQPAVGITLDRLAPEYAAQLRRPDRLSARQDHAITTRLLERERGHQGIVVYQAEAEAVEWTRIAIRQADLVLLLAGTDTDPAIRPTERAFIESLERDLAPRVDLVLLHPEEHLACGAGRWLVARTIGELHHLRCWRTDDFARLARGLTGNAIGLVLSGGGARGMAEIGVLSALRDAGVPIDRIGGTSMGSIIGAMVALGHSVEEITEIHRDVWLQRKPLSDYTFPAMSIIRGRRIHNITREIFANHQIEELPIPFFCVSCNLTNAEQIVHDRGPLWQGVRASTSLPGTGPPLFLDGHVLVDGGVLNNLPVDVMHDGCNGFVIAVDVSGQDTLVVGPDIEQAPSGWIILWRRLNPFLRALAVPSIFDILYRTATLSSCRWGNVTRALADLVIIPPVEHVRILDFKPFDAIIDAGYRAAAQALLDSTDPRLTRYLQRDRLPHPDDLLAPAPASVVPAARPPWHTRLAASLRHLRPGRAGAGHHRGDAGRGDRTTHRATHRGHGRASAPGAILAEAKSSDLMHERS